jgi:hypothetical protein
MTFGPVRLRNGALPGGLPPAVCRHRGNTSAPRNSCTPQLLHPATPALRNVGYLQNEKQVRALLRVRAQVRALLMASGSDDICLMAQALRLLVSLLMCPVLAHPVFAHPVFACPLLACPESLRGADPKRAPGFPKTKSPKTGSPGIWHLPGSGIS